MCVSFCVTARNSTKTGKQSPTQTYQLLHHHHFILQTIMILSNGSGNVTPPTMMTGPVSDVGATTATSVAIDNNASNSNRHCGNQKKDDEKRCKMEKAEQHSKQITRRLGRIWMIFSMQ
jgi:hypothetical protein